MDSRLGVCGAMEQKSGLGESGAKSRSFTCFIAPQTHNEALKRGEVLRAIDAHTSES